MVASENLGCVMPRTAAQRPGQQPVDDSSDYVLIVNERGRRCQLSAPGNRRRQTGLPMASIRLRARQRALKTNWWVALVYSCFAG